MVDEQSRLDQEREELQAVLASGIFARAPSLAHMLDYICRKYFEGEAHLIKEYNIAVEALGRGADFDQKRDSIVRVEAHRLRKRLRQYYAGEGAGRALHIDIPPGSYAPVFVPRQAPAAAPPRRFDSPFALSRLPWSALAAAVVLLTALAAYGTWQWRAAVTAAPPSGVEAAEGAAGPVDNISEIRVGCGATEPFTDREGRLWVPDRFFEGGRAGRAEVEEIHGTLSPEIYRAWREGTFSYRIPLKPGVYEVSLYFAETHFGSGAQAAGNETNRLFDIAVNGRTVATEFDILAESGAGGAALVRTFRDIHPNEDGLLVLEFSARVTGALLSGISIAPGMPGRLRPIRIAARDTPYTDASGHFWTEDRHFFGGKLVKRIEGIQGTEDPELYRGERYGRFTYTISVPPDSTYTAILHFAETWFGGAGQGGAGSRLFDVFCNGARLLQNFDVFAETGGAFRATRQVFRGLKPTPNGKLLFQFIPSRNYAFINALEILDESPGAPETPTR